MGVEEGEDKGEEKDNSLDHALTNKLYIAIEVKLTNIFNLIYATVATTFKLFFHKKNSLYNIIKLCIFMSTYSYLFKYIIIGDTSTSISLSS